MSVPTFFNTPLDAIPHQESLKNYHQQLVEKKERFVVAQEAYQKALDLTEKFTQKISSANKQLTNITIELETCEDNYKKQRLSQRKEKYDRSIKHALDKLLPYSQRLEQLADNLQILEAEIKLIEKQRNELLHIAPQTNLPKAAG